MKIFLAGAGGAIGRRLTPLLRAVGHTIVGTTRSADKSDALRALGAEPVMVDVFDADALARAVRAAAPQAIIHQLTDLAFAPGTPQYEEGLARNARLRIEGTRNLVAAARAANVKRMVAQSIAFAYAPGEGARIESDPLNLGAEGSARRSAEAVAALEQAVLGLPEGIVLRYGFFYGPGTWSETVSRAPSVHIDAAARATLLALTKAKPGIYNIAEDGDAVSSEKAKREFGFDPGSRIRS
ncbi:MAG: NAD(P)-dependent oxidoreductase [Pseudolabrys sp.]|jgi:nucleoside-diphosphate-sugar epimerase